MSSRDSLDRSSVEFLSAATANGSTSNGGGAQQSTDEASKDYHSLVSSNDLFPAVDGVLKSDVCSKSISASKRLSDVDSDCNQYLALSIETKCRLGAGTSVICYISFMV